VLQCIFLSHDVDWRIQGPTLEHIKARESRFDSETIRNATIINPYYNIPQYMEIEEKYGLRSTFFFRTVYENGRFVDYEHDIKSLIAGGWEIGLHSDPSSIDVKERLLKEKTQLEEISNIKILGNRVHYLKFNTQLPSKLRELGFVYDSTVRKSKHSIESEDFGYYVFNAVLEFPITIMDAYLFTYMHLSEDDVLPTFIKTIQQGRSLSPDFNIITVIWHDNVLRMKGGRMYRQILEYLSSQSDVKVFRGIDLAKYLTHHDFKYSNSS
jgi:peptidoglycan/xylan/chitin deacetylase (PgdA/CDA1 family)